MHSNLKENVYHIFIDLSSVILKFQRAIKQFGIIERYYSIKVNEELHFYREKISARARVCVCVCIET